MADSLIALFGGDSSVAVRVRTCLFDENINTSPEWWSDVLRQNSKETMELWCCNLLSKITLAEKITLQYIVPKIRKTDYLIMDAFEINLLPKRTPVHPGELFEADVWLTSYSTHTDNIRMFANEKQLPIENGKAVFNQIYQAAGMKTVDVRIEIHNPLTGEVYNIEKEFNMVVRPKCAPKD